MYDYKCSSNHERVYDLKPSRKKNSSAIAYRVIENTELSKDVWVKGPGQLSKEETIKWRINGLDPSGRGQMLREAAGLLNSLAISF